MSLRCMICGTIHDCTVCPNCSGVSIGRNMPISTVGQSEPKPIYVDPDTIIEDPTDIPITYTTSATSTLCPVCHKAYIILGGPITAPYCQCHIDGLVVGPSVQPILPVERIEKACTCKAEIDKLLKQVKSLKAALRKANTIIKRLPLTVDNKPFTNYQELWFIVENEVISTIVNHGDGYISWADKPSEGTLKNPMHVYGCDGYSSKKAALAALAKSKKQLNKRPRNKRPKKS